MQFLKLRSCPKENHIADEKLLVTIGLLSGCEPSDEAADDEEEDETEDEDVTEASDEEDTSDNEAVLSEGKSKELPEDSKLDSIPETSEAAVSEIIPDTS